MMRKRLQCRWGAVEGGGASSALLLAEPHEKGWNDTRDGPLLPERADSMCSLATAWDNTGGIPEREAKRAWRSILFQ